jgi:hypothetical protein
MSYNVPTTTTLIYLFYLSLESHRLTRFGVFSVHHLQEHLICFYFRGFPLSISNTMYVFVLQNGLKDVKLAYLCKSVYCKIVTGMCKFYIF